MYNLFVSGDDQAWQGQSFRVEISRCVREYTDAEITNRFGKLTSTQIAELKSFPCVFAYEAGHRLDPKFGYLQDVTVRRGQVRVEYELHAIEPYLTYGQLNQLDFELDIAEWEMNRTHWAVKDVNLSEELSRHGITLPAQVHPADDIIDITHHEFDVALSFPGESRALVEQIAGRLEERLGRDRVFYDNNYKAQLARPNLDVLLQEIYGNHSKLVVVFIGSDYQHKDWCGIEFRAIRNIIMARGNDRIMFVRLDDGQVEGVFDTDGYVDARRHTPNEIANFIAQRSRLLE
jgi:hypothetical protein